MSPPPSSGKPLPFPNIFFASAVAACTAEVRDEHSAISPRHQSVRYTTPALILHPGMELRQHPSHTSLLPLALPVPQILTLPLDTAKVRLQVQTEGNKYK